MMVYFKLHNASKMLVNDREMLVKDGEMLIKDSVWSYTHFNIIDEHFTIIRSIEAWEAAPTENI